jgi:hypothetical protein
MGKKPAPKPPANKPNNNKPNNNKPNNNKPSNSGGSNNKPTTAPKPSNNTPAVTTPKPQQNAASLPPYQNDQGPAGNTAPTTAYMSIEDAQASRLNPTANLRNPNKDATHWTNADYGKSFGMKDIKEWQERWGQGKNKKGERDGYRNNDIMKIAQAAYAGGHVKNVNKLNEYLGKMNSEYYNPRVLDGVVKGQETSMTMYPWMGRGENPKRAFEWNGFGNGMTKHERKGIPGFGSGSYERGAQWSLPTNFMNGFSPMPTTTPAADLSDTDGAGGAGTDGLTADEGLTEESTNPSMNQGGYGDETNNSATSFRSAKGTRARAGRPGQGTGSMTNKPARNAWGTGVRY